MGFKMIYVSIENNVRSDMNKEMFRFGRNNSFLKLMCTATMKPRTPNILFEDLITMMHHCQFKKTIAPISLIKKVPVIGR